MTVNLTFRHECISQTKLLYRVGKRLLESKNKIKTPFAFYDSNKEFDINKIVIFIRRSRRRVEEKLYNSVVFSWPQILLFPQVSCFVDVAAVTYK